MKTTITITGQLSGNFTLRNAIKTFEAEESKIFNNITLEFPSKKAAKKALWEAFKKLRSDEDYKSSTSYCAGYSLSYDASSAKING